MSHARSEIDRDADPRRGQIVVVSEPGRARLRIEVTELPLQIGRDCEGLLLTDPQIPRRHLGLHNSLIRRHVNRRGGSEIKAQGDPFMLSFPSARHAVQCMVDIQRGLAAHARSRPADGLRVRIGAHPDRRDSAA